MIIKKYFYPEILKFRRKKRDIERLKSSFGKLKDDRYNFELIEQYFRRNDTSAAFQILSEKTCNDLDFQELFMLLFFPYGNMYNSRPAQGWFSIRMDAGYNKIMEEKDTNVIGDTPYITCALVLGFGTF